ncbi:IgGFc-binding protein [Holothuria leucospilota]|uniref:IgGFc-binding protein n=1 Tax=Holothuria leucospilota TaxID=206669 RepID=A0A9Q1BS77_HOLLE|nr:IgGFc-binding protein [Holothuria leucospilota]
MAIENPLLIQEFKPKTLIRVQIVALSSGILDSAVKKLTLLQSHTKLQRTIKMRQAALAVVLMATVIVVTGDTRESASDFTCINSNPFYKRYSNINFIAAGPGTPPVKFRRYQTTGKNQKKMPKGSTESIDEDIVYRQILKKKTKTGEAIRNGVFSCTTSSGGKNTVIPVFSHLKTNKIVPDGYVTKTVNKGDNVELSVVTRSISVMKLKWRKNAKEVKKFRRQKSILIENASVKDGGIYECYVRLKNPHAVMRLIVRECAANLIGENCDQPCYCYNGGVCSDNGECICPPGFSGDYCEEILGPNCFGQSCQYSCSDPALSPTGIDGTCEGHLFCLPDPYGCSCSPGFKGLGCNTACEDGTFGANCEQTCHCADGSVCDNKMGICSPARCQDGWTGDNCNERITCRNSDPCQNGGVCQNVNINQGYECICTDGFTGRHCETPVVPDPCNPNPCENDGTCQRVGTGEEYECRCADGFTGDRCENGRPCQCELWGDPHHRTFDRVAFTFQGECEYVISEHTEEQSGTTGLPAFTLSAQYHRRDPGRRVTYVTFVRLQYNGKDYRLQKRLLFIAGALSLTPYNARGVTITLRANGAFRLTTDFGLIVEYRGTTMSVSLDHKYKELVNGICGNCDGDKGNDCRGRGRSAARCGNQFAIGEDCDSGRPTDPCLESKEHREDAKELCDIISKDNGPFSRCSEVVDLGALKEVCEYDLCATLPDLSLFCNHLENLVTICKNAGVDIGTWREAVPECPFDCPAGTVYNHCGNACPATCAWDEDENCGDECMETCECPENFVIADGKCIPREECGCQLEDGSYLPGGGKSYNGDCSEMCSCDSGRISCQTVSCHRDATCERKSGVQRCYCNDGFVGNGQTCKPVETCKCTVWGDPHYITFDRRKYDFQGDCEYTLLTPCQDSDQPNFELIGNNLKNSQASRVSYLRQIRLIFQGKEYELIQGGAVIVDGQNTHLPYQDGNGVRISKIGNTVLQTDFGLKVTWNNRQTAVITLKKSAYFGNTCGLCGTCNNIRHDEFLTRDGATISNVIEFASSWKTGDRQCIDPEPVVCPADETESVEAQNACNAIIDPLGALAVCHDFVDPQQYYETCVYDLCAENSITNLCNNIKLYAEECHEAGGKVPFWYEDRPDCKPACPEDMVYAPTPINCPPSCAERDNDNCEVPLLGICQCPAGLLIDGDKCAQSCGGCHLDDGSYLQNTETIVNDDCSETCTCVDGQMQCSTLVCSEFAECGLRAGVRGCVCQEGFTGNGQECVEAACECLAWGDPHYVTFDGARYDFQGDCEYVLVERCPEDEDGTSDVPQYRVVANNVKNYPGAPVSYTRAVRLEVGDHTYEIKNGDKVFINGIQEPLPYEDEFVNIHFLFPRRVVIETSFQLSIIFQSPHTAKIKVYHEMHLGRTCGLCGTCNRNPRDEFSLPNGELSLTAAEFGNAWATDARECVDDTGEPACEENSEAEREAFDLCSVLTSVIGPFASCHDFVDPEPLFDTCSYDVCAVPEKEEALCDNLAVYARSCQEAGGSPGHWWNKVPQCDPVCPDGMIYDPCGSACQETCAGEGNDGCTFRCEEVCRCPDGQVLDGDECVPRSDCGCQLDSGGYLQVGEKWTNEDCTRHCKCTGNGIQCQEYSCPPKATCVVKNGIRDCYCLPGYSMRDGACERGSCVCNIYGDPHYSTFDGRKYDYQGDCEYILIEKCEDSDEIPDFKLIGRHSKNAPADRVSYLRQLRLEFNGNKYTITIGGRVLVNGLKVFLPYVDRDDGIRIGNHVFGSTTIITDFGLVVIYDNLQKAEIHLGAEYFGLTCGMCGTCTDDTGDDLKLQNGAIANSVAEFGAAYRYNNTCETEGNTDNPCEEGSPPHAWAKNLCHAIIRNPGPFSECFDFLDPQNFYESCVMDVCVSRIPSMACSVMDLYFQRCWQLGAKIPLFWDEVPHCPANEENPPPPIEEEEVPKSLCELLREHRVANIENRRRKREVSAIRDMSSRKRRQANQGGQTVGTCANGNQAQMIPPSCQATCDDVTAAGCNPNEPLVLTCICPMPLVLQGNECIQQNECPCDPIDGIRLEVGQCQINIDCTIKYCCDANRVTSRNAYSCDANAACSLVNNVRVCKCKDRFTGNGQTCKTDTDETGDCSGDPHFYTFDGRRYDFMGACEYTLVEVCAVGGVTPFKIIGDFGRWVYNTRATVTNSVRLEFEGSVYEVRRVPRSFLVNGAAVNLPYTKGQVTMSYYPSTCIISGRFGIRIQVTFGSTYLNLNIRMSSIYRGKTCGLLGNANGNSGDDFRLPNGVITNNVNQFGNSWTTGNRQCQPPTGADPCAAGSERNEAAKSQCFVLLNRLAPFSACHELVDPQPFYTSCVFDVCATNLNVYQLCGTIKNYVRRCRALQGNPGKWWTYVRQCAVPCPEGWEYTDCGTSCPATCEQPNGVPNCEDTCTETCLCPEGQVLDGTKCVFPYNCGCTLSNDVYLEQDQVYVNDDCSLQCTCDNGEATCVPLGCKGEEVCKVVGGERGCFCRDGTQWNGEECSDVPCQCTVWGDPHYITFDGKRYDFQGDCEYILVESCNHGDLPSFKVIGSNDKNVPSAKVSFLRRVRLEYNNMEFEMFNSGILKVNDVTKTLPYSVGGNEYVTVTFAPPNKIILTTHFNLQLTFTYNIAGLKIEVGPDYYEKLCGMCGTCNRDESDDFLLPSQEHAESSSEFGNGWATGNKDCSPDDGVFPCEENSDEVHAAEDLCFVLTNEGPLRVCHEFVDPQPFFQTCVYDVCATNTNEALCANIDQYVQTCRRLGGNPGEWWKDVKECAAPCPKDMIYTQCGTGCPATCARRNQQITCNVEGIETCLCPEGKLLDGQQCVYPEECGCDTEDGTYISPGSVFITEGCTERCTCTLGQLECEAYQCHAQASCEIRSGDRDCYCTNGYIGNGQECEQADCECFIWGDDHFCTFDHVMYRYNGGCEHTLLRNWDNTIPSFSLVGKFVKNDLSSELEGLRLDYNGGEYEINQDGILVKDGEVQSKTFFDGKVSSLNLAGGNLVIATDFGLSVFYDRKTIVSIKLTAALRGKTFGMCGTCNNDKSDDLTLPGKTTTTDIIEFGNQWVVVGNCNPNADDQDACEEGSTKQVEAKDRCYPIVDPNGAFADCHDYLHPVAHYQTCIQDYCREEGLLCDSFTSYAAQCRSSGGNPQDWRKKIKQCKFRCSRKNPYSSCTSGCPRSCVDLNGDEQCLHSCVEDCQCPFGLVLKDSKCVKPEACDCYVKEQRIIIPENVPIVNENCTQITECMDTVVDTNVDYACDAHAFCGEKDGVHGCHCSEGYTGDGQICRKVPRPPDCNQALKDGNTADGVYTIYPVNYPGGSLEAYCDMTTDGGGWTIIQRRTSGAEDFTKDWDDYKNGFGDLNEEFWLGNEAIHFLTRQERYTLRFDTIDCDGVSRFATYEVFETGTEGESYQLNLAGGTKGSLFPFYFTNHNSWKFYTRDRDNVRNCAKNSGGGWWLMGGDDPQGGCHFVHLNGDYQNDFEWQFLSLQSSEMKIRPVVPTP